MNDCAGPMAQHMSDVRRSDGAADVRLHVDQQVRTIEAFKFLTTAQVSVLSFIGFNHAQYIHT